MNAARRPLQFDSIDAIMPDVDHLVAQGSTTVGHWTLGQICEHLATVTALLVDLPATTKSDPAQRVPEEMKRQIFTTGRLPEALPMPGVLTTPDAVEASVAADRLRAAIDRYQASPTGPVAEHRLFGPLSHAEWNRLVCIHSAHHLSFAIPKAG